MTKNSNIVIYGLYANCLKYTPEKQSTVLIIKVWYAFNLYGLGAGSGPHARRVRPGPLPTARLLAKTRERPGSPDGPGGRSASGEQGRQEDEGAARSCRPRSRLRGAGGGSTVTNAAPTGRHEATATSGQLHKPGGAVTQAGRPGGVGRQPIQDADLQPGACFSDAPAGAGARPARREAGNSGEGGAIAEPAPRPHPRHPARSPARAGRCLRNPGAWPKWPEPR
uniref:Uncharacterized protein n=1 Tax=Molossus molossus TaxID=27622 RepID=A0A7J8GQV2_MOLMO|nr:hypothetical protein HJG59_011326 [Molossus molossus]